MPAHLTTPPQAPAGAPPDVSSQLLSLCEGYAAQATQQHMGAFAEDLQHYLQVELEEAILPYLEDGDEAEQHEEEEEPLAGPG